MPLISIEHVEKIYRRDQIEVPVLVLWGDGDEVFPSPLALAAAAELPRSMLRVERGGHSPHHEDPARALVVQSPSGVEAFVKEAGHAAVNPTARPGIPEQAELITVVAIAAKHGIQVPG